MTTISVTFDPPLLSDSREVFDAKAFALVAGLNTFSGQANAMAADVNAKEAAAAAAASSAATQAGNASASAATAAAQATAAATQAGNAAASATTATNKAAEAETARAAAVVAKNQAEAAAAVVNPASYVQTSGNQSVGGVKTFSNRPVALAGVAFSASSAWTVEQSGADLIFKYDGVNRMKLDSSGNLTVSGNVTAYGAV